MKINITLDEGATLPKFAKPGDSGMDLVATSKTYQNGYIVYGTGLCVEYDPEWTLEIRPRSSIRDYDLLICNSPGTVDAGYRHELMVVFKHHLTEENFGKPKREYEVGNRIAQMVFTRVCTDIEFEVVDKLSETERGSGGYGSTGK